MECSMCGDAGVILHCLACDHAYCYECCPDGDYSGEEDSMDVMHVDECPECTIFDDDE